MGDNIKLIYDPIYYLNYDNLPGLLICIDFEKAFDSVDWNFMMKVLKAFGFGPIICHWIYTFYNIIKSTVIVNGHTPPPHLHPHLKKKKNKKKLKEDVVKAIQFRLICFCCM